MTEAAAKDFSSWLQKMRQEAIAEGISPDLVVEALPSTLKPDPRVLTLDRKQPETTITFAKYFANVVTEQRVRQGRRLMAEHHALLQSVSRQYGVQPEYIVALWGIETNFGQNTGGFDVVSALATLAYDGRREAFFREELLKALKIIDQGHIDLDRMKGSWAGAMGQCQFMPSSFLRFAVDHNKDGKIDIWHTKGDVFASAANYLAQSGWQKGQGWGYKVKLPQNFNKNLMGLEDKRTLQFWHDAGVRQANGKPLPFEGNYSVSLIYPRGDHTSPFLIYDNYRVILKWNNSTFFATSVGLLADRLKN